MQDPLKQGLKPSFPSISTFNILDSNARSTKTRIETEKYQANAPKYLIRMQDPLKQGLKHKLFASAGGLQLDSNARSTKTRIETNTPLSQDASYGNSNARSTKTRIET